MVGTLAAMRSRLLGMLAFAAIAVACGGKVEGSGGAGGAGGGGGEGGGSCGDFATCCARACIVASNVQCGATAPCGCDVNVKPLGATCVARLTDAYRCVAATGPAALACDSSGLPVVRCGACQAQVAALQSECGTPVDCAP